MLRNGRPSAGQDYFNPAVHLNMHLAEAGCKYDGSTTSAHLVSSEPAQLWRVYILHSNQRERLPQTAVLAPTPVAPVTRGVTLPTRCNIRVWAPSFGDVGRHTRNLRGLRIVGVAH